MSIRVLSSKIDPQSIFALSKKQYSEKLYLSDIIQAGSTQMSKVSVAQYGHFLCQYITGSFSTLYQNGGTTIDHGVCTLKALMTDGTGQRRLFNDYIPLSLFLSPGRQKSESAANVVLDNANGLRANASNSLFYPLEFEYFFPANTDILLDVKNSSNVANSYDICFHGVRVLL